MHYPDQWHDLIRISVFFLALYCIFLLWRSFVENGEDFNTKTRDLWFSTVLWCLTAMVLATEGIVENRQLEPRLVFYTLATILTYKALRNKGTWGKRA